MSKPLEKSSDSHVSAPQWPPDICDGAIEVLDDALKIRAIDETLLQVANRQALKREIGKTLKIINQLDLDALFARQSWIHRFTGAHLEERLKVEVAARKVTQAFGLLERISADNTKRIALILGEQQALAEAMPAIDRALAYGHRLLSDTRIVEPHLRSRFERKLANLETVRAANLMAIQQFAFVRTNLIDLNDRFQQIAAVLFPLWQQRLFALLHRPGKVNRRSETVTDFLTCHEALQDYFQAEAQA